MNTIKLSRFFVVVSLMTTIFHQTNTFYTYIPLPPECNQLHWCTRVSAGIVAGTIAALVTQCFERYALSTMKEKHVSIATSCSDEIEELNKSLITIFNNACHKNAQVTYNKEFHDLDEECQQKCKASALEIIKEELTNIFYATSVLNKQAEMLQALSENEGCTIKKINRQMLLQAIVGIIGSAVFGCIGHHYSA